MLSLNGEPLSITRFPDQTSQVWKIPDSILDCKQFIVDWNYTNESDFMHLAQLKDLLDKTGKRVRLNIKYLPYARQDKDISNTATFAFLTFARLLNSLRFDWVYIADPHSARALRLIHNSVATYPVEEVMGIAFKLKTDLFCYPDHGAVTKYTGGGNVQNEIYDYPCVHGEKVRDQLTGNITSYQLIGDVAGKNVLIVDDICDGGMTFKLLAKDLIVAGATEVNLFVSHGIFSKGVKTLRESGIKHVFTPDGEVFEHKDGLTYRRL